MKIGNMPRWLRFNARYLGRPAWDAGVTPPEVLAFMRACKPGRALDLGCGTGTNLLTLAQAGWQVTGVEYALIAWLKARRKLRASDGVEGLYLGSVAEIDYLRPAFDLILDIGCYHGLGVDERQRYQGQLQRLLAPGGTFLLYGFLKTNERPRGIDGGDMRWFSGQFTLLSRQEGWDHNKRPSVWLRFKNDKQG